MVAWAACGEIEPVSTIESTVDDINLVASSPGDPDAVSLAASIYAR